MDVGHPQREHPVTEPERPSPVPGLDCKLLPVLRPDDALNVDLDIEALRQRVAALTEQNIHLTEAVAARDALLAVAGHELRNPMTPILGRVEILKRLVGKPDFQPQQVQKNLEQIEWLIRQYMKRATTLLDVSRITSGKLALSRMPVDVRRVVHQVVENFRPIAEHAGCDLMTELPDDLELAISGDPLALEEIVDNMVSNAIKYGQGKPIMVSAHIGPRVGIVTVEVRDQGTGISEVDQRRIFERFERAVSVGERKGGFGVGLWIVRQLAEAMGGKIEVLSEAGAGSTFRVSLPAQSSGEPS
jgi:two-component system OmpR family sensor kinase